MLKLLKTIVGNGRESQDSGPQTTASEAVTKAPTSGIGGTASRKQLLAVVLRETLMRNGVPNGAIGMEFFRTMDRSGSRTDGIHVRLVLRELHDELAGRIVALERDFRKRLTVIDWRAAEWLQGVSWQLELPEEDEAAAAAQAAIATRAPRLQERRPREQDARGHTYTSTEPAPL